MDLIHQLNYKTFVEEIPQHQQNRWKRLVDARFHAENTYNHLRIWKAMWRLVGMLAARGKRPFSLDQKLENPRFLSAARTGGVRNPFAFGGQKIRCTGQVFQGLMALMWQLFVDNNFDLGIISGTTRQRKLYEHVGFIPFGPLVGAEGAQYQPMYLSIESFEAGARDFLTSRYAKKASHGRYDSDFARGL